MSAAAAAAAASPPPAAAASLVPQRRGAFSRSHHQPHHHRRLAPGPPKQRASCACSPTTHPGSFRCKHHRHVSNLGAAAAAQVADEAPAADADAKHHDQADKSS